MISELLRQQTILYHADSRSIPDRIVSLSQAHIRPIVRGKARCNVEFGAKISISVTGEGFAFLCVLNHDPFLLRLTPDSLSQEARRKGSHRVISHRLTEEERHRRLLAD